MSDTDQIATGLAKLHAKRAQKRVNQKHDHDAPYADNPHFGMF